MIYLQLVMISILYSFIGTFLIAKLNPLMVEGLAGFGYWYLSPLLLILIFCALILNRKKLANGFVLKLLVVGLLLSLLLLEFGYKIPDLG